MAVPKRKISKARGAKRRTHWKVASPGYAICPHCGEPMRPHRVCPHCGFYKGEEIIPEEAEI